MTEKEAIKEDSHIEKEASPVPTMKSYQAKAKETEGKLQQLYENLQQDWNAYKQSNTRTSRRCFTDSKAIKIKAFQLLHNSPRDLMSKLQQQDRSYPLEEAWKMRTRDLAAHEIILERREAIETGKLKGRRRLFEPPTGAEGVYNGMSDMVQESEVRSVSYYGSEDGSDGTKGLPDFLPPSYSSSSSSTPCLAAGDFEEKVDEVKGGEFMEVETVAEKRVDNEGRYIVFLGGLAVVLLIFALCMSGNPERCFGGYGEIPVPT